MLKFLREKRNELKYVLDKGVVMKRRFARPEYMDTLDRYRETKQIKVLTGVSRCGKSTLSDLCIDHPRRRG